jgi:uncharacterized Zn finger protein
MSKEIRLAHCLDCGEVWVCPDGLNGEDGQIIWLQCPNCGTLCEHELITGEPVEEIAASA